MKRIESKELDRLSHNFQVRFAVFCANQVKDQWKSVPECVEAIRITELWLEGKASSKECEIAADAIAYASAAINAAWAAYAAAGYLTASYAAIAAGYSGVAVEDMVISRSKTIEEQWDYYSELLHFDEIAEKTLLGEGV